MQVFGRARYDYLVTMCDEMGIVTPNTRIRCGRSRAARDHRADVPAVRLHVPAGGRRDQGRRTGDREVSQRGGHRRIPLLSSEPYATRDAWCRARLAVTRSRLEELD